MTGFTEWTRNIFSGSSFEDEKPDYHVITTDHPWMIQIGLGSFTTGILQKWWDHKDQNGVYNNRKLFGTLTNGNIDPSSAPRPDFLLDGTDYKNGGQTFNHSFTAWRNDVKNYITYEQVLSLGNQWKFKTFIFPNVGISLGTPNLSDQLYTQLDANKAPESTAPVGHRNIDSLICNVIEMNNYIRLKKINFYDETANSWSPMDRARAEFIRDIKSAKNGGGVTWSGYLPFVFNINDPTACTKWDWVKFNLQLFDDNRVKRTARSLGVSDFNIIGTPIDSVGRAYANRSREDGKYETPSIQGDVGGKAVGQLDTTFNEFTGKWESGTPQIIARMVTTCPAAINGFGQEPDVDQQVGQTIDGLLDYTNANYQAVSSGIAMPIVMQNANPLQWSPQYAEAESCRAESAKKNTVVVFNKFNRSFAKGEMVLLAKIGGTWQPVPVAPAPGAAAPTSTFDGLWDFTYLLSNARYHMSQNNTGLSFHYDDYEKLYYKQYYGTDPSTNNPQQDAKYFPVLANTEEGYLQITSWDFMGPNLGGNCAGNNIGGTIFDINVNGEPIGENADGKRVRTKASAPFFGCTFPGGYVGDSIYNAYNMPSGHAVLNTFQQYPNSLSPFFNPVDSGVKVFANTKNNNNSDGYNEPGDKGMFAKGSSNLVHFPADMAVNASPSGENGRPISDIRFIYQLINPDTNVVNNAVIYFSKNTSPGLANGLPLRYAWMFKGTNPWDSAWDLAPKNKNIIEFRPLTRDVFNCLEVQDLNEYTNLVIGDFERGLYGRKAQEVLINKGDPPMSPVILKRTTNGSITKLSRSQTQNYPQTSDGLTNQTRLAYGPQDMSPVFGSNYYTENQRYLPAPYPLYEYGFPGQDGGAAIGIITAICTTTAPSKIVFNTQTYIGVQTKAPNTDPAHGGSQRPQDFGCTALHARVFSAWPRELTVYDSRFFSVFHFNYGAGVTDTGYTWYFSGSPVAEGSQSDVENNAGSNYPRSYPDQYFKVDKPFSEVDFRVPTWKKFDPNNTYGGNNDYRDTNVVIDNYIINYGTQIFNGAPLRDPEHWRIYGQPGSATDGKLRRGKLLPVNGGFYYRRRTIRMPPNITTNYCYDLEADLAAAAGGTPVQYPQAKDKYFILIVKKGKGYKDTNTFKVAGGNGTGVLLNPEVNSNGGITGFKFVQEKIKRNDGIDFLIPQTGYDFLPSDFLEFDTLLDGKVLPSAKITAVDAAGEGFEGYVIKGFVGDSQLLKDISPVEVTEGAERLTPSPSSSDNFVTQPILDDLTETSIGTEGKSSDNKFDIYFFFHNDVTHHSYDDSLYSNFFQSHVRVEILQE